MVNHGNTDNVYESDVEVKYLYLDSSNSGSLFGLVRVLGGES